MSFSLVGKLVLLVWNLIDPSITFLSVLCTPSGLISIEGLAFLNGSGPATFLSSDHLQVRSFIGIFEDCRITC